MEIKSIKAREILDSKGWPTIEVDLETSGFLVKASVPSGTSKGKYEAVELRDGGKRYLGRGVLEAVKNINEIIAPKLIGEEVENQKKIDQILVELDGTKNKSRLGANAIIGVSMAVCRAGAKAQKLPLYKYISQLYENTSRRDWVVKLPNPCFLMIEGGLHAGNDLDIQEFMIAPEGDSFKEKLQIGTEIYHTLFSILEKECGENSRNVGYEGGFAPPLKRTTEALNFIIKATKKAGYQDQMKIILDVAASSFFKKGIYRFEGLTLTKEGLLDFYTELFKKYPIFAIEDPFSEDDWEGFKMMTEKFGKNITIIGDDLLVTNLERIKKAVRERSCNGLILKPNQIGTITETIEAAKYVIEDGFRVFVKQRGGETPDDFIADLAVGLGAGWIMSGAPARGERVAKYNRLLEIEDEL
ncbi:phosphopyruvate hydratase [Patescibacteria group bacterium]|nr:phosphopyruvate hydratase [Patescibacteria group bacterium]